MALSLGIVGLPNVGKSTLFNLRAVLMFFGKGKNISDLSLGNRIRAAYDGKAAARSCTILRYVLAPIAFGMIDHKCKRMKE